MMLYPPNTFLQFWKKFELLEWIKELEWRKQYIDIWKNSTPTMKQTKEELRKRTS